MKGWATTYVLAPLIISVLLVIVFFFWEAHIDEIDAAMCVSFSFSHLATALTFRRRSPPSLWSHPNVPVLTAGALLPFLWWIGVFVQATTWFEDWFGWSALNTAVHL
jgi:hypothetical protein